LLDSSSSGGSSLWSSPDFKKVAWESSSGLKIYDSKTKSSQSFSVQRINNMVWHDDLENITFETFDGSKDSEVITLNLKTGELTNYSSCMAIGTHLYLQSVSPDGETIIVLEYTPDGNQLSEKLILVSRDCQGIHELYNINRPAKYTVELGQLLKRESVFQGVSWSSNSQQFVVSLSGNLFILDKTGENKSALAGWTTERAISPMWLPDSDLVYYLTDDSLIVINTDTIEKEIIGTLHQPQDIILSPNMEYFLIPTTDADRREALWTHQHLWIYKVKDNELIHLTDVLSSNQNGSIPRDMLRGFVSNPSWSPDGKWVGYLSDDKAELINIDSGSLFTLPENPYSGFLGYDLVWLK